MVKIEAESLETAYSMAAQKLSCSITQLNVEVIQVPSRGILGLFKKQAIIVATANIPAEALSVPEPSQEKRDIRPVKRKPKSKHVSHNEIILPESFVTDQEDDYDGSDIYEDEEEVYVGEDTRICEQSHEEIHEQLAHSKRYKGSNAVVDNFFHEEGVAKEAFKPSDVVDEIKTKIDQLFKHACFDLDEIKVAAYDDVTILVEFTGKDAALLIGKEGYRYKALSYMLYN